MLWKAYHMHVLPTLDLTTTQYYLLITQRVCIRREIQKKGNPNLA